MTKYALIAALLLSLGLGAAAWWQSGRADSAEADAASLRLQLGAVSSRLRNIERDRKSDAEIENLSDDDLRIIPPGWFLPASRSSSVY